MTFQVHMCTLDLSQDTVQQDKPPFEGSSAYGDKVLERHGPPVGAVQGRTQPAGQAPHTRRGGAHPDDLYLAVMGRVCVIIAQWAPTLAIDCGGPLFIFFLRKLRKSAQTQVGELICKNPPFPFSETKPPPHA